PTALSSVLYVDLIHENKPVQTLKLPLEAGVTWGDFKLSDSIPEGNYRIRAYTQWMRNAGEGFFFTKTLAIGNGTNNKVFVSSGFDFGTKADSLAISGVITFNDARGTPYANKQVATQLQFADKSRKLINGQTDSLGQLKINFRKPEGANTGMKIMATIEIDDKKKAVKYIAVDPSSQIFDVQFFPEGGQIVKGIPIKIAVKATNGSNGGEIVEGTISDKSGETTKFTTNSLGLGYFIFNALSSSPQKASITFKNGTRKEYILPKIEDSGYALMLKNNGVLQVYLSSNLLNKGNLSVVGQRNGNIYFVKEIPTNKQAINMTIPSQNLPSGVLQLTLFTAQGAVVCERFTFINHQHDKLDLKIDGLKASYTKRSQVELTLNAKQQGLPVNGSFSVSVTNTAVVSPDLENETNILTTFLLNADATNPIEKPNAYFGQLAQQDIDLLMLTSSWRHIPWHSVKERKNAVPKFNPEKTLTISGTLTDNNKPVPSGKVTLMKSTGGFEMLSATSDAEGKFKFDSLSFADSTKLLIQARTSGDKKNVKILIDRIPGQAITIKDRPISNFDIQGKLLDYIRQSDDYFRDQLTRIPKSKTTNLKEVEITAGPIRRDDYVRLHGKADQEFTSKELDSATFLSEVLMGEVRGNYRGYSIMLDGSWIEDKHELAHFFLATEPSSLERIEAISSPHLLALYKSKEFIFFITTKKNYMFNNIKYAPGLTTLTPKGFSISNFFYSPDYSTKTDNRPDFRPTVYWNPNVAIDEKGNLKINYFNTDLPGKYRVVIEGIGGNRGLARKEIYYEVTR
ncbi:MAG: carboxypeptidase regulatory-like domain-containing protein, partial [Pedobacter sp.]|nr:carboxypeptidase regulatory-like domain-containing protein [Pedobacter sp.]